MHNGIGKGFFHNNSIRFDDLNHIFNDSDLSIFKTMIMVAIWNGADQYIFILWFLSIYLLLSFFPRLISAAAHWMSTILPQMVWP